MTVGTCLNGSGEYEARFYVAERPRRRPFPEPPLPIFLTTPAAAKSGQNESPIPISPTLFC